MWFVTWYEMGSKRFRVLAFRNRCHARNACEDIASKSWTTEIKLWEGFENYA